jgi:hypothetical protein
MVVSILMTLFKFVDKINQKADKEIVERIKENLIILSNKIDTTNEKLDEIKIELRGYKESFHSLEKEFTQIKIQHEINHKEKS